VPIGDETIAGFLGRLAGRVPAPGGSSAAAMHAALGAALLGMVARFSAGDRYAEHQATIGRVITEVDELRGIALRLIEADEDTFSAVASAYHLPEATEKEQAARTEAIGRAVHQLAWPAARVIGVAKMLVDLAEALAVVSNQNLISDVAAAAEAARAAAATARVSLEINLAGMTDELASLEMLADLGTVDDIVGRAEKLAAAIRQQIRA
jgi:formiminotetrahydrofolate cyclodeaminase